MMDMDKAREVGAPTLYAVVSMVNNSHVTVSIREKPDKIPLGDLMMTHEQFRNFYRLMVLAKAYTWRRLHLADNILRYNDSELHDLTSIQPSIMDEQHRSGLALRSKARTDGDQDGVWR